MLQDWRRCQLKYRTPNQERRTGSMSASSQRNQSLKKFTDTSMLQSFKIKINYFCIYIFTNHIYYSFCFSLIKMFSLTIINSNKLGNKLGRVSILMNKFNRLILIQFTKLPTGSTHAKWRRSHSQMSDIAGSTTKLQMSPRWSPRQKLTRTGGTAPS